MTTAVRIGHRINSGETEKGGLEEAGARRMTAESAPPGTAVSAVRVNLCVGRTCSRLVQLVGGVSSAGYSHLASLVAL